MSERLVRRAMLPVCVLLALGAGCKRESAPQRRSAASTSITVKKAGAAKAPASAPAGQGRVAKVVFVGKQDACDCTRKRVDETFAALQRALGGRRDPPVERLRVDTDPVEVAPYQTMRAITVLPAVYLLDRSGGLVELLQGEVSTERFSKALQ